MRKLFLTAATLATLATVTAPTLASAYTTRCEARAHDKKVTGTVIGGVLGALAGNALGHGGGRARRRQRPGPGGGIGAPCPWQPHPGRARPPDRRGSARGGGGA